MPAAQIEDGGGHGSQHDDDEKGFLPKRALLHGISGVLPRTLGESSRTAVVRLGLLGQSAL
jgi:hypothetical protein